LKSKEQKKKEQKKKKKKKKKAEEEERKKVLRSACILFYLYFIESSPRILFYVSKGARGRNERGARGLCAVDYLKRKALLIGSPGTH
jgi:hypothetical protein